MPKFRKKPVVIEAFKFGLDEQPEWFKSAVTEGDILIETIIPPQGYKPNDPRIHECHIKTLEGVMTGNHGDYIIQGVKGEIYPCKPDIFEATYEPAE
jgi:hypothetical protein